MYCEKCGNQIEDGAKFCTRCGLTANKEAASQPAPAQTGFSSEQTVSMKKNLQIKYFSLAGVLGAVLMLLCTFLKSKPGVVVALFNLPLAVFFCGYGYSVKSNKALKAFSWIAGGMTVIQLLLEFKIPYAFINAQYAQLFQFQALIYAAFFVVVFMIKQDDKIVKYISLFSAIFFALSFLLKFIYQINFLNITAFLAFAALGAVALRFYMCQSKVDMNTNELGLIVKQSSNKQTADTQDYPVIGSLTKSAVIGILSILSAVSFFLPFVSASALGIDKSISAMQLATSGSTSSADQLLFLLIVLPIMCAICSFIAQTKPYMGIIGGIMSIINIIISIVGYSECSSDGQQMLVVGVSPGIGLILSVISYALILIVWLFFKKKTNSNTNSNQNTYQN